MNDLEIKFVMLGIYVSSIHRLVWFHFTHKVVGRFDKNSRSFSIFVDGELFNPKLDYTKPKKSNYPVQLTFDFDSHE